MNPVGARRDTPIKCSACGRTVMRRARQQRFCSDRCRDFARRENKARTAIKNPAGYVDSGQPTNPIKSSSKNSGLQGPKNESSLFANGPLNILGGGSWRWPNTPRLDADTLEKIQRREIGRLARRS